jgi:hypothetical protein
MKGDDCDSIITDQGPGFINSIKKLQVDGVFQGNHLFDGYHALKNCKIKSLEKR